MDCRMTVGDICLLVCNNMNFIPNFLRATTFSEITCKADELHASQQEGRAFFHGLSLSQELWAIIDALYFNHI